MSTDAFPALPSLDRQDKGTTRDLWSLRQRRRRKAPRRQIPVKRRSSPQSCRPETGRATTVSPRSCEARDEEMLREGGAADKRIGIRLATPLSCFPTALTPRLSTAPSFAEPSGGQTGTPWSGTYGRPDERDARMQGPRLRSAHGHPAERDRRMQGPRLRSLA